jgi:hypothetical protein
MPRLTEEEMLALRPVWKGAMKAIRKVLTGCKNPSEQEYIAGILHAGMEGEWRKAETKRAKQERAELKQSKPSAK